MEQNFHLVSILLFSFCILFFKKVIIFATFIYTIDNFNFGIYAFNAKLICILNDMKITNLFFFQM